MCIEIKIRDKHNLTTAEIANLRVIKLNSGCWNNRFYVLKFTLKLISSSYWVKGKNVQMIKNFHPNFVYQNISETSFSICSIVYTWNYLLSLNFKVKFHIWKIYKTVLYRHLSIVEKYFKFYASCVYGEIRKNIKRKIHI